MSTAPATRSASALPPAAISATRRVSDLGFILPRSDPIAHAADGLDHVHPELLPQPPYKDFDRVGIAVEILIVEMLGQFRPGNHLARMVHEVFQDPVLVR